MLNNIMTDGECSMLRSLIDEAETVVLCCHQNPDGDALGSMLGMGEVLRQLGKDVVMVAPDQYPDYLQWLPNSEKIVRYDKRKDFIDTVLKMCSLVICLDFNTASRTDEMADALLASPAKKVLIDHHPGPDIPTVVCVSRPELSSTSELVFRMVWQLGLYEQQGRISIWMDDIMLSAPTVQATITDGKAQISGNFTSASATQLAEKINAGALPVPLETSNYGQIAPTLGMNALTAMGYAGVIAFIAIALIMLIFYRLPGFIAIISLLGQMGLSIAAVSGYFPAMPSFTMTLPGIAGLILSIGMGVDCNVITAERIKEELAAGRTLDGALDKGTKNSLSAIVDGNMTVVIVSIILMLVFGPSNILSFIFGESTTGTIYAFGYTLLVGVISNFIMGIFFSRLMLRSVAGIKPLRKKWLFGGAKNEK